MASLIIFSTLEKTITFLLVQQELMLCVIYKQQFTGNTVSSITHVI